MARPGGVILTDADFDRVAAAVRWVERNRGGGAAGGSEAPPPAVVYARLTSGTADGSGHYPAVITVYSAVDAAWTDYSAVKVKPPNGETLTDGTRYAVRPAGTTAGGDELYVVVGGAAVGSTAALARVKSSAGVSGYWNAVLMSWNAGTNAWVEGSSVVVYTPPEHSLFNLNLVTDEKIYAVYPLGDTFVGYPGYYLPPGQLWVGGGGSTGQVAQGLYFDNDLFTVTFSDETGASVAQVGLGFGYADLTHDGLVSTTTQTFGGTKSFPGGVDALFLKCGTSGHSGGLTKPNDTYLEINSSRVSDVLTSQIGHLGSLSDQVPYLEFVTGSDPLAAPPDYYSLKIRTPKLVSWNQNLGTSGEGKNGAFGDYTFVNGICTGYSGTGSSSSRGWMGL